MRATSRAPTEIWEPPAAAPEERFGPYRVHEELGRGGPAGVPRAVEIEAERLACPTSIALKRLRPELATDWELVNAFVHEAWIGSQLDHEHVVRTHATGRIAGAYYIAMELVAGP